MAAKTAFCELFVIKTILHFTHFSAANFREIWQRWISITVNSFGTELWNFSDKGSFILQKHHFTILWVFRHTFAAHAPALAFRSTANLSIAPYSRRAKDLCSSSDFLRDLPFSRYRHAPLISGTPPNSLYFGYCYMRRLVSYRRHIWQLGRSKRRQCTSSNFA